MPNENAQSNPSLEKLKEYQNRPLTPKEILIRMVITSFVMFITGFIIITIWAYAGRYQSLPVQGDIQLKANGEQQFVPYYPIFYRFAIVQAGEIRPTESLFDHIGALGLGAYFYSVVNAPQWCLELNAPFMIFDLSNGYLRGMEFIPYIMMFAGLLFFFKVMIPRKQLTPQLVLNYSIVISLFQSIFVILLLLASITVSNSFALLFDNMNFYQGQFIGVIAPGICLIFVYALFVGALVGTIYSSVLYFFYLALIFFGVVKPPQQISSSQ